MSPSPGIARRDYSLDHLLFLVRVERVAGPDLPLVTATSTARTWGVTVSARPNRRGLLILDGRPDASL